MGGQERPIIQAIPTLYTGIEFRSRIEARWAVVFTELGIDWEYEREGYALPSGWYLPDFYLRGISAGSGESTVWFEVKGKEPTRAESVKAWDLAEATGEKVIIAWGAIPKTCNPPGGLGGGLWDTMLHFPPDEDAAGLGRSDEGADFTYQLSACPECGKLGFVFTGYAGRICPHAAEDDDPQPSDVERIDRALRAGSSERFKGAR